METRSHAELTLLALLSDRPTHAYALVGQIRSMQMEEWAQVAESTVYAVLRRMEDRGWVRGVAESGERGRARTRYRLTRGGHARLAELVSKGLEDPAPIYSDQLVAAVFASGKGLHDSLAAVARTADERRARLRDLLEGDGLSGYGRIILRFYSGSAELHAEALKALIELDRHPAEAGLPALGAAPD